MMNEEIEQFEQRLQRQPLREIPGAWRGDILAAAGESAAVQHAAPITRHSPLSIFNLRLSAILWPHPKAWAGLAAVWILIGALNFSARDTSPPLAEKFSPPSPEVIVELKKQQRMFAELVGGHETADADRPKVFFPKPRSGRTEIMAV